MAPVPLVVLLDGECALCNRAAVWFARRNQAERLIFATNGGSVARMVGEPPGGDQSTIVVWQGSRRLVRSEAILAMLASLGGGWGWVARLGTFSPRFLRDALYDQVARRRHLFGAPSACTLLSPHHLAE